jgi:hypothetical protein
MTRSTASTAGASNIWLSSKPLGRGSMADESPDFDLDDDALGEVAAANPKYCSQ